MTKILVITGPTASGKTDFAISCAKNFNGEIISADSMQIYKYLNIGTAKPTDDEKCQAVHHLVDIVNPDEEFSVQQFVTLAQEKIADIFSRDKLPIVVGGTGLYIKSLLFPYSFCSAPKNTKIREEYSRILTEKGKDFLFEILLKKDPISAQKIHKNDTKRVIRALEILETQGENKTSRNIADSIIPRYDYLLVAIDYPREKLYERINARVDKMFEQGLINEVGTLKNSGKIHEKNQSMQAIGYKELFKYFSSELTLDETKELIKKNTRNYAKRQLTFIRGFKNVLWITPQNDKNEALNIIKQKLEQ